MIGRLCIFLLGVVLIPTFARAGDVEDYVQNSKQEVHNTKKKLQSTSGIFGQPNFRGTVIRPAQPSEESASDQSSEKENSGD